ncbi:MAG TPA: hypothetical protein VFG10_18235 [Saprospiraceae bacterium]|nr:hypothetical protein [Saprospiraceae bacterium]
MKKNSYRMLWLLSFAIVVSLFTGCKEDEVKPIDLLPNLNGLYVYGTNTVATKAGTAASKVNLAVLDHTKGAMVDNLPGVFGKFIHIGANSTIKIAYVQDATKKIYGAAGGGSIDSAIVAGGQVKDLVIHGTLLSDGPAINVASAGLYYLFVDVNTETFILMPVKANIIGDATALQWAAGTALPLKSSDTLSTVFEGTNIPLVGASGYRYRFNDGWHAFEGTSVVTLSSMGVTSYGASWDSGINDIGFHLDNAPQKETGIFTITLTYNAKTGEWTEVKTKTGELLVDHSADEFGWFGNAYYVSGSTEGAWDAIHHIQTPVKDGNLYNWVWHLTLIQDRSFVLRQNGGAAAWITFGGAAKVGTAFTDGSIVKENGQDNYFVATGGNYLITFTINAEDEGRILTIEHE